MLQEAPILLADSGSTKTDWIMLQASQREDFRTEGLNPSTQKPEYIRRILAEELLPWLLPRLSAEQYVRLRLFSAGTGKEVHRHRLEALCREVLPLVEKDVLVGHDMLGAGLALFGRGSGIACILGTGSNAAYCYSGRIELEVPSGGYLLGDEGSGNHLGKRLAADYLYGFLPEGEAQAFEQAFGLDTESLWENVYFRPNPNRFLASLAPFISQRLSQPYFRRMVVNAFQLFFDRIVSHLRLYAQEPIGVVGSVGFAFQEVFTERALANGYREPTFLREPKEALVQFYRQAERTA
jgi:N-acetylglucosamine kinase-like BadF-type ATPase